MSFPQQKIKPCSLLVAIVNESALSWITLLFSLYFMMIGTALTQPIDRIVAIVNNEVITQAEVEQVKAALQTQYQSAAAHPAELAQQPKQEDIVNQIIEEKLVLSEAKKYNIQIDEEVIDKHIGRIRANFSSDEEFESALEKEGLTIKNLRDRFHDQEMMKKVVDFFVRREIKIDPRQIEQYYQDHQQEFIQPERALVKSIFIKVEDPANDAAALQKAKMLLERLTKGEDFAGLAKKYSQGVNAQEGGSLGYLERGQMIKEIDEAIFRLNPEEHTGVIKTEKGYYIFKIAEKEAEKPLPFYQAQDVVRQALYRQKFAEAFKNWLTKLKQNAYIEIKK